MEYASERDGSEIRTEFGIPKGVYVTGSLGRLTYQKGFDLLLVAIAELEDLELVHIFAGHGEEAAALKRQASELGLAERVIFPGFVREVPRFLSSLDVYIQPSRFEGMPFAVLEAMASECPVVATAVDGITELIEDGVHGRLVEPEDPRGLAAVIRAVIADPARARTMGAAARKRVCEEFDDSVVTEQWERLIYRIRAGAGI
jgi:glycosyltransferase involved in cell wall biosynthesis